MHSQAPSKGKTIYFGTIVHSLSLEELEICENGAVGVNEQGKITFFEKETRLSVVLVLHPEWTEAQVVKGPSCGFFFPGFIDTHIHAPQYPNAGIFGSTTLLSWLETYTFPTESSFSSLAKARTVYNRVVSRTLSNGTTTAAYYATIHVPATNLLSSICLQQGQRAFIGRVCMNCNAPAYYIDESVEQAMKDTRDTIEHVKNIDPKYDLISPIVTPRFAVSCTSELLFELGKLAKEEDLPIQTHISENVAEIDFVSDLFPEDGCYTKVYDNAGLLTNRTILAHAVHITKPELKLISKRGAKVSHCPVSNSSLGSGMAKVREILDAGVDVGLGTDVSGGYSTSVLESARQALLVSRLVANLHKEDRAKLSVAEILYLGTLGGAKVMGLQDKIGNFAVGKEWDAIMVGLNEVPIPNDEEGDANENLEDDPGVTGNVDIFEGQSNWEDILAKWVYTGDDRNNLCVWVKGRLVHDKRKGVINVGGGASGLSLLN